MKGRREDSGGQTYEMTITSPLVSLILINPSLLTSFIHFPNFFHSDLAITTSSRFANGIYAGRFGNTCAEYSREAGIGNDGGDWSDWSSDEESNVDISDGVNCCLVSWEIPSCCIGASISVDVPVVFVMIRGRDGPASVFTWRAALGLGARGETGGGGWKGCNFGFELDSHKLTLAHDS